MTQTTIDSLLPTPNVLLQIFGHLEYRDIVSVGRTCKQWHHLSQDELLLRKIASRDFTPETWPHRNDTLVPYLCITSTGPTADRHSEVLGLYALVPGTRHGGKPVYQQMDGDIYSDRYKVRYDSDNQVWTVVEYSRRILMAKTTTSNPTTAAWKVGHQDDVTLTVAAMTRLPPACSVSISCTSSIGDERLLQVNGEYAATDQYRNGRVVYKNVDRELYLFVRFNGWVVDGGSPILHSQAAPSLCPAAARADPQAAGTRRRGWRFGGPSNVPSDSIVVKCLVH